MTTRPAFIDDSASGRSAGHVPGRTSLSAAKRLERSHRIPLWATSLFAVIMLVIWLMGRSISGQYVPDVTDGGVEWVRSDSP